METWWEHIENIKRTNRGWVWVYIHVFYWLVGRCTQRFFCHYFLFIKSSHLYLPISKKKSKHWALPQNRSTRCFPLANLYSSCVYESSTLAKAYRIKVKRYWEHLGEHKLRALGNPWELDGNTPPIISPKEKNWALLSACWTFSLVAWIFKNCLSPLST